MTFPITSAQSSDTEAQLSAWLESLSGKVPALGALLRFPGTDQLAFGYYHTLREICQQPITWISTADLAVSSADVLTESISGVRQIVLTGSGSSVYAAECVALNLQASLGIPAQSIAAGQLLTHGREILPPSPSTLLISLARSGDSPESCAVVQQALASEPNCRHLIITCNENGRLARDFRSDPRVRTLTLAPQTCDRSLVMTSSFTNMVLAGWSLASLHRPAHYRETAVELARAGSHLLARHSDTIATAARLPFHSAVYLASGGRIGAAHECALKMLESTGGRIQTFSETFLGLRHGPMSAVHEDTLVVCFLSSDPRVRPYELDLISELNRKGVGAARLILGSAIPGEILRDGDIPVDTGNLPGDSHLAILDTMVGQLLAFFRCLHEGLRPDSPSASGVINRVVETFPLYLNGHGDRS